MTFCDEFDYYPFAEGDFPGGPRTVCRVLLVRMHQMIGTPAPDDERGDATSEGVRPGSHRSAGRVRRDPRTVRTGTLTARIERETHPAKRGHRHASSCR